MSTVLVTGSKGFIGRNLVVQLRCLPDLKVLEYDLEQTRIELQAALVEADVIIHLAGANRPERDEEFMLTNAGLIEEICTELTNLGKAPKIIFASSTQATLDNPYGQSKKAGEEVLRRFQATSESEVVIYRLTNVFGKWCRPNYNSAVATFCHNIAHDLPIQINDGSRIVSLVYVDDVVAALVNELGPIKGDPCRFAKVEPIFDITLGELAAKLANFRASRQTRYLPEVGDSFTARLYATYLSYLHPTDFAYNLTINRDARGSLAEFIKSSSLGQVFISRTNPGITRGDHFHHTKVEKFLIVEGEGIIRFRQIEGKEVIEYKVKGQDYRVVDIPPGYTHSIENVGTGEMVVIFWASEMFDPNRPDTIYLKVKE